MTLKIFGDVVVGSGSSGITGTSLADNSVAAAKLAFTAGNMIHGRQLTAAGKGAEFPCSDQSFEFLAAETKAAARAVIGAAGGSGSGGDGYVSTDPGAAAGPILELTRDSASPINNDLLGRLSFLGNNGATPAAAIEYAAIQAKIVDIVPVGGEDGQLDLISMQGGAKAVRFSLAKGLTAQGLADKGVGTVNATGLYVNGTAVSATPDAAVGAVVGFSHNQISTPGSTTTAIPADNTIPQSTEGSQFLTCSHTPKQSGNLLKVEVVLCYEIVASAGNNTFATAALFKDADTSALSAATQGTDKNGNQGTIAFNYVMTAPSTTAILFKLRAGPHSGTFTLNTSPNFNGRQFSSIIVTEIQT